MCALYLFSCGKKYMLSLSKLLFCFFQGDTILVGGERVASTPQGSVCVHVRMCAREREREKVVHLCVHACVHVQVCILCVYYITPSLWQFGDSLLHFAALHHQSEVAKYLVAERGVSVNDRNTVCVMRNTMHCVVSWSWLCVCAYGYGYNYLVYTYVCTACTLEYHTTNLMLLKACILLVAFCTSKHCRLDQHHCT